MQYFDVFTFHKHGKPRTLIHNSAYIMNALSLIFRHSFFDGKEQKNLVLWSDNGKPMKSANLVLFLASLAETRFATVNQKFFVPFHGKSICDRHFGCIARTKKKGGNDILSTPELWKSLEGIDKKVFIEMTNLGHVPEQDEIQIEGISGMSSIERIRREGESMHLKSEILKVDSETMELKSETEDRVFSKKRIREKRRKKT